MDNKKHNIYQSLIWVVCILGVSLMWATTVMYTNDNQVKIEQIRWEK